jgi:hypothetical protein
MLMFLHKKIPTVITKFFVGEISRNYLLFFFITDEPNSRNFCDIVVFLRHIFAVGLHFVGKFRDLRKEDIVKFLLRKIRDHITEEYNLY